MATLCAPMPYLPEFGIDHHAFPVGKCDTNHHYGSLHLKFTAMLRHLRMSEDRGGSSIRHCRHVTVPHYFQIRIMRPPGADCEGREKT